MRAPADAILAARHRVQAKTFVETGTYMGDSALWAADHFATVHTVEASWPLFTHALSRASDKSNIVFHHGRSQDVLPGLCQELNGAAVFWLDAHWSGGPTFGKGEECPLLTELDAILNSSKKHAILIDDLRLFQNPPPPPHNPADWPTLAAIKKMLKGYDVTLLEDQIQAVPA